MDQGGERETMCRTHSNQLAWMITSIITAWRVNYRSRKSLIKLYLVCVCVCVCVCVSANTLEWPRYIILRDFNTLEWPRYIILRDFIITHMILISTKIITKKNILAGDNNSSLTCMDRVYLYRWKD